MTLRTLRAFAATTLLAASSSAFAQELIEKVVVRNRLYSTAGKFEIGPSVGLQLVTQLVDQGPNLTLDAAYNAAETLAVELKLGYALSRQTTLARDVLDGVLSRNDLTNRPAELSNLWMMKANALVGARWAPIYGKISLFAELPVHMQAYLWAGAGGGMFQQRGIVYCRGSDAVDSECLEENDLKWIASGAFGLRFWTHPGGALRLEVRNYLFPDKFRRDINVPAVRASAIDGSQGEPEPKPGMTNNFLFHAGYQFIF